MPNQSGSSLQYSAERWTILVEWSDWSRIWCIIKQFQNFWYILKSTEFTTAVHGTPTSNLVDFRKSLEPSQHHLNPKH
jgi:hypothetical protein